MSTNKATNKSADPQQLVQYIKQAGPAPVHLWDPPFCGDMDMRIAADGQWFYRGSPLGRLAMVKLFASVLKREGDEYFLVTPVEKLRIQVDDCPFVATVMENSGKDEQQILRFTTNVGDTVTADADHPLQVDINAQGEPHPILEIRRGLKALVNRNVFYRLVDMAQQGPDGDKQQLGVYSSGRFFSLGRLPAGG